MWHSIAEEKNAHIGKSVHVVGAGPNANSIEKLEKTNNNIFIAINRGIVHRTDFDYMFVDHHFTLNDTNKFHGHAQKICMPIWSRKELNINNELAQQTREKIRLYTWVYKHEGVLQEVDPNDPDGSLNDIILYIDYGNLQSIISFAKLIGANSVTLHGCNGSGQNGQYYSDKILQYYPQLEKIKDRRVESYQRCNNKLFDIAKKLKVTIAHANY